MISAFVKSVQSPRVGDSNNSNNGRGGSSTRSFPSVSVSDDESRDADAPTSHYLEMETANKKYNSRNTQEEDPQQVEDEEEVYIVSQRLGYCSILFSLVQTVILIIMMWQCGVAPLSINPMVGPYPDALSEWGGKNAINILEDGEWWRLVTPILLHAGVIHLICNIAVQLETGAFFEREWGSVNWLIVYLTSAVGSSILSTICMPNSVSVGSSGAVMGLFGGKLAEVICRCCEATKTKQQQIGHEVRKEQLGAVLCSVALVMAFSFIPYVDWAAHLGGLVAGLLVGFAVFSCKIHTITWRLLWFLVGFTVTLVCFIMALQYMYVSGEIEPAEELRDVCGYYQQFFEDYECKCMRDENGGGNSGD
mmetsp:Transcript_49168/g.73314  ORF Transcript_49168/g.73314 Transcript_49168/m.73314 type:complete len:364 (-) Transcript_49168:213-1304(-)|eukprot:CAMPEP_0194036554 /NCGR_PEP_ID=MMETSP0009_2-20130614/8912_1 /TAXON_ID=210454 /ORGANISM="Grammatophora oceanica, Strain CCMP 410" /LENGTH=363 /DNA_ID=CAMNT_0038678357 /DNA_START=116 /DNA_END=1207 /DNA_ORIENTATION=-